MKIRRPTRKEISAVVRPTCGVAAGKRCVLMAGGPETDRTRTGRLQLLKLWKTREPRSAKASGVNLPRKKKSDEAFLALVAHLKKELSKPRLTKSVREKATKKQIALGSAN